MRGTSFILRISRGHLNDALREELTVRRLDRVLAGVRGTTLGAAAFLHKTVDGILGRRGLLTWKTLAGLPW